MPKGLEVFGLLYDNETGRVRPVDGVRPASPAGKA
jgi:hypothetical protein